MTSAARPGPLQAWAELSESVSVMRTSINRSLQQEVGLTLAENLVLCQVAMAPGSRLKMVEIAEMLGVAKSAVTKTVDRLEDRGWLVRRRDDDDRRIVRAALTPDGARVFRRAQPVFLEAVTGCMSGPLTATEVAQLRRLLRKMLDANGRAGTPRAGKLGS